MKSFLEGFANLFNIYPSGGLKTDARITDAEVLAKDWQAVGNDIRTAIEKYEDEIGNDENSVGVVDTATEKAIDESAGLVAMTIRLPLEAYADLLNLSSARGVNHHALGAYLMMDAIAEMHEAKL